MFRYSRQPDGKWQLCNSKPCKDCTALIKKAKIHNVYYSVGKEHPGGPGLIKIRATRLQSDHVSHGRLHRGKTKLGPKK